MTYKEAKKIGITACINAIGYDFCKKHSNNGVSASGFVKDHVECFVGVSDKPAPDPETSKLVLTSHERYPYSARCTVSFLDGSVEFSEIRKP